jgi:CubicO group peptidase (beta-lactamase class C family)
LAKISPVWPVLIASRIVLSSAATKTNTDMRIRQYHFVISILFSLSLAYQLPAQTLPDSTIRKIEGLFFLWNSAKTPGCAIGIVRGDSLIYAKGYGMSNLEYDIPNTPATIFHMASISKQFTAYSIVLLARQGKLSLEDDVRKYLTWFPDLKQKITIRNLLNHTSGIRDQWQLLAISGTRLDDVITQDHIIKILSRQQALNFTPGDEYNYSNSGFTMLAEIVKVVSGQSLRKFTDSAIFKPLGMDHTHFHDDYTEIEKNRAYSYERAQDFHFINSILSYSNDGATSLFTNVGDMSKWIMNFYDHKVGDQKDIDQLTKKGRLNNGKDLDYALGIVVDKYKGWKRYSHNGADAGFRTSISVFPDLKMGFIVFSNLAEFGPSERADKMADIFLKDTSTKTTMSQAVIIDSNKAFIEDTQAIKKILGDYISDDGTQFTFRLRNNKLYWEPFKQSYLMIKAVKDTFVVIKYPEVKFVFSMAQPKDTLAKEYWPNSHRVLSKYIPDTLQTDKQFEPYPGFYYCPELDCKYRILLKDHHLWLTNSKYNDTRLTLIGENHLIDDFWWMDHLVVFRDAKNDVQGFEVNSGRIQHLKFYKVE